MHVAFDFAGPKSNFWPAMAQSIHDDIEIKAQAIMKDRLGEEFDANNNVINKVQAEALRCQRWYCWRYDCQFTQKMIMEARLDLTFWEEEEQWYKRWLKLNTPVCISQ